MQSDTSGSGTRFLSWLCDSYSTRFLGNYSSIFTCVSTCDLYSYSTNNSDNVMSDVSSVFQTKKEHITIKKNDCKSYLELLARYKI